MRIFLDTNVLLDVFLKRAGEPDSSRVIAAERAACHITTCLTNYGGYSCRG